MQGGAVWSQELYLMTLVSSFQLGILGHYGHRQELENVQQIRDSDLLKASSTALQAARMDVITHISYSTLPQTLYEWNPSAPADAMASA